METGYFEIRLESIGGLGANLCGKLLGELAVDYLNLNAACFSSYGSEKTGSPVTSYIRWCQNDKEIRKITPIISPDIIGIFHEAMIGGRNVFTGADNKTRIVINSNVNPGELRKKLGLSMECVYTVDCQKIAEECHSRVNMVMLGAIIRVMECVEIELVKNMIQSKFKKNGNNVAEHNIAALTAGYEQVKCDRIVLENVSHDKNACDTTAQSDIKQSVKSKWGYENAPLGGVNPIAGNAITNDLSASRHGKVPVYLPERCIHCGLCDTTCPDMVFRFEPGEYNKREQMVNCGLDYHHCKGCMRCVEICPTHALVEGDERSTHLKFFVRNKDLIVDELDYEAKGANSWVTSESYINDGGLEGGSFEA